MAKPICYKPTPTTMFKMQVRPFSNDNWSPVADDASEAQAIDATKQTMAEAKDASQHIVVEMTDMSQWEPEVMKSERPVVLDVYADWCGPCRKLTPLLTDMVNALNGEVRMVKVNSDNFPQLSQALNVRALPSVFLVFKGNVVDAFTGIPDKEKLEKFFTTAQVLNNLEGDENIMNEAITAMEGLITKENYEQALQTAIDAQKMEKWVENVGTELVLIEAYALLKLNKDTIEVRRKLAALNE